MSDSQKPSDPSVSSSPKPDTTNLMPPEPSVIRESPKEELGNLATKKELHFLEKLNIFANLSLVVVGLYAAFIYHGQLTAMQGQLNEMQGS